MIDPGTATLIGGGLNALGGLFGGGGGENKDAKRQFNIGTAPGIARLLQTAPLRDKLLAILGNMAGSPPAAFAPSDLFNPAAHNSGTASLGGRSRESMMVPAGYQDGSGEQQDLYRTILGQLGYKKQFPGPSAPAVGQSPALQNNTPVLNDPRNPLGGGLVNPGRRSY